MPRSLPNFPVLLAMIGISLAASGSDFSKAFENLRTLGLPDVRDAQFGTFGGNRGFASNLGGRDPFGGSREFFPGLYNFEPMGNAWLLRKNENGDTLTVVANHTKTVTLSMKDSGNGMPPPSWETVELGEQWKQIEGWLDDPNFAESLARNSAACGSFLLFAAHLARVGLDREADQLARAVLDFTEDPETAVTTSISLVASGVYESALDEFYEDQNTAKLADKLEAIAVRFGPGWHASEGTIEIARLLASQPESPPEITAPKGIDLSPELQEIAASLSGQIDESILQTAGHMGLWIIGGERQSQQLQYMPKEQKNSPIIKLILGGSESIPLLIALLDDLYFLPLPAPYSEDPFQDFDRTISEAAPDSNYRHFPRPATRSDIAYLLLRPLVPGSRRNRITTEDFRSAAIDWWSESEEMSETELARYYFRRGDQEQQRIAVPALISLAEESDFVDLEDYMLRQIPTSYYGAFNNINLYVEKRGEDSESFAKEVKRTANEYLASIKNLDESRYSRTKEQIDTQLKMLDNLTSSATVAEMLAQVAAGELELRTAYKSMGEKLLKEDPAARLTIVLEATAAAEDENLATQILNLLAITSAKGADSIELPISQHSELWEKILEREIDPDANRWESTALTAAFEIERIYGEDPGPLNQLNLRLGNSCHRFALNRARDRIAGKSGDQLDPVPTPDSVSAERRTELETKLTSLGDTSALRAELELLDLAERMWATGEMQNPAEEEQDTTLTPVQKSILRTQYEIVAIDVPDGWSTLKEWKGEQFDTARFEALVGMALEWAGSGETFVVSLNREPGFGPLSIAVEDISIDELSEEGQAATDTLESMSYYLKTPAPFVAVSPQGNYYNAFWVGESEDEEPAVEKEDELDLKEGRDQTRNTLDRWLHPAAGLAAPFAWKLLGTMGGPP